MEKRESPDGAAIVPGTEKAVIEELGRKELGKVAAEYGRVYNSRVWLIMSFSLLGSMTQLRIVL